MIPVTISSRFGGALQREATALRLARQASRLIALPFRAWQARRDLAALAAMSDHELRDIGLTRQDLRDVTGHALGEDPTEALSQRVAERRRRHR